MRDQQKRILAEKATQLIEEIVAKKLSQKDIARLTGISTPTLSKLKSIEYLPKNVEDLLQKLSDLKDKLDNNPHEAIEALQESPSKDEPKSTLLYGGLYFICLGLGLVLGLGLGYLLFPSNKDEAPVPTKPITIKEAFEVIFESDRRMQPYSKNTLLPCYRLQKKWQMDDKQPYTIVLPLMDAVYYYRSKSVDLHAWCQIEDPTGKHLEALELLTNELWKDTQKRRENFDSLKCIDFSKDASFIKLAEVNSIFSDVIQLEKDSITGDVQPISRNGKRIARYYASPKDTRYATEVNEVIDDYISCLSKTDCHSLTLSNDHPDREFTLQIDCTFFEVSNDCNIPEQEYSKVIWR